MSFLICYILIGIYYLFLIFSESSKVQLQQSKDNPIVYDNYKVMYIFQQI
jgi:hypothetical protein